MASNKQSPKKPGKKTPAKAVKKAQPKSAGKSAPKKPSPAQKAPAARTKKQPAAGTHASQPEKGHSSQSSFNHAVRPPASKVKLTPFLERQKGRLLALKDTLLDSMSGVARDSLRSRAEGSEASAFGMHQADAGSDAYDRDFALSLLSQEQDSLYEIDEALKRIDIGTYGICEMSNKAIPHARLEALPFTRYTVECQADIEKRNRFHRFRQPVGSLFGLSDEDGDGDDDDSGSESKE